MRATLMYLVVASFLWQDNTCDLCRKGLQTSCRHGGRCLPVTPGRL